MEIMKEKESEIAKKNEIIQNLEHVSNDNKF